jgi:membrane fusion protein (multidrug efflux system)
MKSRRSVIAGVAVASLIAGANCFVIRATAADEAEKSTTTKPAGEEDEAKGTASVQTSVIREGEITQSIAAFGSVTAQPGSVTVFSVAFECQVKHILISAGQQIDKDAPLIEVEPSPAAKQQLLEARNAVEVANKDLEQTQQRFNLKLATNTDLLTSQQAMQLAKMKLDTLQQWGATESSRKLTADGAGLVSKVDVQEGQIVPAGGPLVETLPRTSIEVRLGVEPSDVHRIKSDQTVQLFPLSTGGEDEDEEAIEAKIRLITQRVNPETRLVDVFVMPDSPAGLLLDSSLRATLTAEGRRGLIVPREAVLPDEDGLLLFTVQDGKAVKHVVKQGLKNNKEVEVIGEGLKPGDTVVVGGNLELEDGMAVTATPATAPTTEAAQ